MELFDMERQVAFELKNEIDEIDQRIYNLYGLTEEEIEIVENSVKSS